MFVLASCGASPKQEASAASAPRHSAVVTTVGNGVGQQFFRVDSSTFRDHMVHVHSELREGHVLSLVIDNFDGFGGTQVMLDVTNIDDRRLSAVAAVAWSRDYGPPFHGPWEDVFGEVSVSSTNWAASSSIVVHFNLGGTIDEKSHATDGEVIVRL